MDLVSTALPVALGIVMLGLGLGLTVGDFARIAQRPRVVLAALLTQLVVLPAICVGLIYLFGLSPILAVGMMLLAASPGGPAANLYSHLFGGDVALNVSLTAINSVLAIVTMPVIYNLAAAHFAAGDESLGLQFGKAAEVFAIVLVPVGIGMLVRRWRERVALRLDRPVRIASMVVLGLLIGGALLQNRQILADNFGHLAGITAVFGMVNLALGYVVPRVFQVTHAQSVACSFEIGLHNAVMAIVVARTVIGSEQMALPPAVYTVIQLPLALVFGLVLGKTVASRRSTPHVGERLSPAGERP
ncbi:bile acid:sodium symporter family protein [Amycolatopsis sp. H20-H5]|uniref:bile acid:sodium symporter family protein n=1 Tax=Amycolatopsis sp. H20-H5 TaxID=3046309 RepID=UPI002DB5CBBA|nr:bile acid:sodium symporter [Amycolatopsis sp. H20-H5]MEC3974475.1 bile acid:sodium symporter [Amycolatopsis sp. H20-H5]